MMKKANLKMSFAVGLDFECSARGSRY